MKTALYLFIASFLLLQFSDAQVRKLGEVSDDNGKPTVFSIDPNNRFITIGNDIGILSVFDATSNNEIFKVRPHSSEIEFLDFYASANEIVTATNSEIVFSKMADGSQVSIIKVFHDIELLKIDRVSNQLYLLAKLKADESQQKQIYKVDLSSRRYDPVYAGAGVDDIVINSDEEQVVFCKGTKINFFNAGLSIIEETLKSEEASLQLDYNSNQSGWLVSHDRFTARFWKISTGRNYQLKWDAVSTTDQLQRLNKVWALNEEGKLLFYGEEGLKIRNIKKINEDITIQSASGKKIESVELSVDRSKILFQVYPNTIEIWSISDSPVSVTSTLPTAQIPTISVDASDDQIYQKYKADIDKELALHSDLFAPKGEFERTSDYETRLEEANKFKQKVFDYYKSVANREAELAKEFELARLKILADQKREDSLRKIALYKDKIENSYEEFYTRISSVGTYDPDKELFPVTIDEKTEIIRVPFDQARDFKAGYLYFKVVGAKQLLQDGITEDRFNYKIITDKGKVYDFGKQRKPLFVSDQYMLFKAATSRNVTTQSLPAEQAKHTSSSQGNVVDKAIFNYFENKQYHALLIAVNDYADTRITQLDGPVNDAQRLKDVLKGSYTFEEENITFLKNPTRTEIIETFDRLQREIGENDNLLVFYAGHGIWDEGLKQGFWLPSDSKVDSKAAWLSNAMIRDYIGGINSKHTLLVADACFSGGIFKSREVFVQNRASLELAKLPSRKAITSGAMKTVPDQSVFIEYLIKRLKQNEFSLLPTEQLFTSFKIAVMNNSHGQVPQYGDIQGAGDEGGDFVFVKRD